MRVVTDVTILSVEQFTYSEFLMSLSDPTAFYAISMRPLEGTAALELNPSVAFTMIDRMLGGSGRGVAVNRALTEIEQNVTDGVVKLILENLTDAWRGIVDVQFRISGRETRPQMLQVAAPNEVVLLMSFEIRIGDTRGVLNICFPAASIEAVSGSFTRSWQRTQREMTPAEQAALDENIGRVDGHPVGRDRRGDRRRRVPAPPDRRRRRPRAPGVRADRGQRQRQGQVHRGAGRDGGPLAHPDRGTRSRVPDPRRLRLPMSPLVRELAQVLSTRFAGVMQSVVTPEAEALPFDGAVAPGWLVPCELAGPIAGTWYLAITSEDAARLASRVLMKETASPRRNRRGAQGADGAGAVRHRPRRALHRDDGHRRQAGDRARRARRRRGQLRLPPRRRQHALLRLQLRRRSRPCRPVAAGGAVAAASPPRRSPRRCRTTSD